MDEQKRADVASLRIDPTRKFRDQPGSRSWRWLVLIAVVAIIIIVYFIAQDSLEPATKVETTVVTRVSGSESQAELVASGYVVAQRKAEVASKGTGRLKELRFEEGDTVTTGQVIAVIENNDVAAQLKLAEADLARSLADSLQAQRTFNRYKDLLVSGSVTTAQYEDAETSFQAALAAVQGARAAVTAAEVELENTYIRAPFSGTVLTKNADIGEIVAPFASSASSKGSVVTLADMASLEVEADVSEANINKVSVGQPCQIVLDAFPDRVYPARVKKIVPTADRARATVQTKVAFDSLDSLVLPEMSARVNFFTTAPDAAASGPAILTVKRDALTTREGQKIAFRIVEDKVQVVPVSTGRELGNTIEIVSGLTAGDRVVLSPPGRMVDGQRIEIVN